MEVRMTTPTAKTELRKFAWVMTCAFGALGFFELYRGGQAGPLSLFGIASIFLLCGLVAPAVLGPVHRLWVQLAYVLAWINTRVILGLFFYVILTPVSTVMRLARRDILRRRFNRTTHSYWHSRGTMKPAKSSYEHLY